ncbi:MAG: hypothetical protein Q8Q13_01420 [bacterium]|nr:hypothetical protein [bacterium]
MPLISENFRDVFGDIRLGIIFQDKTTRLSCIRRISDNEVLSFHIVLFSEAGIERLGPAHEKIVAGGLLGEVIKESGVSYTRTVSDKSFVDMDAGLASLFATGESRCTTERIEYQVRGIPYAAIYEFYNSKYTPVAKTPATVPPDIRTLIQKYLTHGS